MRDLLNSVRRMSVWLLGDTLNIPKTRATCRYGRIEHAKSVSQAGSLTVDGPENANQVLIASELEECVEVEHDNLDDVCTDD